jgi:Flp pilus assembly protein TadG
VREYRSLRRGPDISIARLARLWMDTRGGLAVTVAIWLPLAAVLLAGAVDLAAVNALHQSLQDTADAAALDAARQMSVASGPALSQRVNANIAAQLGSPGNLTYTVSTAVVTNPARVTVTIQANRTSFFANLLPPGGWNFTVSASAEQMSTLPLCVLQTGMRSTTDVNLAASSRITASGCAVHANGDVKVANTAMLSAGFIQASGTSTGPVSPAAQTSAPSVDDPFSGLNMSPSLPVCIPAQQIIAGVTRTLLPGVHCGSLTVGQGARLTLLPGEHYFVNGSLILQQNAVLTGDDVVLFFDRQSDFHFNDTSDIELTGRRTGPFAGFVLATTRDNNHTFDIQTTSAHQLLGTVYVPSATLHVSGNQPIGDQSAWTVIVAQALKLDGSPNLVINSNYSGSSVPVPVGVGPSAASVRLAH